MKDQPAGEISACNAKARFDYRRPVGGRQRSTGPGADGDRRGSASEQHHAGAALGKKTFKQRGTQAVSSSRQGRAHDSGRRGRSESGRGTTTSKRTERRRPCRAPAPRSSPGRSFLRPFLTLSAPPLALYKRRRLVRLTTTAETCTTFGQLRGWLDVRRVRKLADRPPSIPARPRYPDPQPAARDPWNSTRDLPHKSLSRTKHEQRYPHGE